jgi:hypothetical protein
LRLEKRSSPARWPAFLRLIVAILVAHWIGAAFRKTPLPSDRRLTWSQVAMTGKPEDRKRIGYVRTRLVSPAAFATGPGRVHGNDASEKQSCSPPFACGLDTNAKYLTALPGQRKSGQTK